MASETGKITKIGLKKGTARASCVILLLSLASFGAPRRWCLRAHRLGNAASEVGASYKAVQDPKSRSPLRGRARTP